MVTLQLLHPGANAFSVRPPWGVDMEIDALKPAVVYSIQWEAEWTQIRFSHKLRHRKWAVGIATALETQTIHLGVWGACGKGLWAQGKRACLEGCSKQANTVRTKKIRYRIYDRYG